MNQSDDFLFKKSFLKKLFLQGVKAVKPKEVLPEFIENIVSSNAINNSVHLNTVLPICIGKASVEMAKTFNNILKKKINKKKSKNSFKIRKGILVVNEQNYKEVANFNCFASGHPLPNKNGLIASKFTRETIQQLKERDFIVLMLSGGGSAMLPDPSDGISLKDKIIVNQKLLECGANIKEMNAVRKHLSKLKGGNFLRHSYPAKTFSYIISDVVGNDLSSISSGLTAPDPYTFQDVINICEEYKILNELPVSVKKYFIKGLSDKNLETPKQENKIFNYCENKIIASNNTSLDSIKGYLDLPDNFNFEKKIHNKIWKTNIEGDVKDIALKFVKYIKNKRDYNTPTIFLSGGETTVKLKGKGKGGRNQEFALYFSIYMKKFLPNKKYTFLSGGTDGRDGPTDSAGGIVDQKTIDLCKEKKINIESELKNNNSYSVLEKLNSHIKIQGTSTNVADIQILAL